MDENNPIPSTAPLRRAYTLWAPIYDGVIDSAMTRRVRRRSIELLRDWSGKRVLLVGVGSGLDLPFLPSDADYTGIDITPAMLERARRRAQRSGCPIRLMNGNAMSLPFDDGEFDRVIMHLILAVVPDPARALSEAARVLRPGGEILILDKFLRPGQHAPLRRALNHLTRRLATRMDVVLEDILAQCPGLTLSHDEPAFMKGWFRHIIVNKD
ncbi:MAG: class I SAM-dependent methyltransferase [Halothiobacillaceae bacterium]|nr:MAG: class I SAM-dependent methyltransferase [Halothiobacillaceae bacterium]